MLDSSKIQVRIGSDRSPEIILSKGLDIRKLRFESGSDRSPEIILSKGVGHSGDSGLNRILTVSQEFLCDE